MNEAYITAISAVLPNPPVNNDEMENVLGLVQDKKSRAKKFVLRSNGIKTRYYVLDPETRKPNYTNASLAAAAIRNLESSRFSLEEMQLLACGTTIQDQLMPNHAVMVHGELKSPPCEVVSMSGICLSGTMAMKYAWMSVKSGEHKNAIATGSEIASLMMKGENFEAEVEARVRDLESRTEIAFEKDFLRWMLSDGAGAVLIQDQPDPDGISLKIHWMDQFSYAGEMDVCMYAGGEKREDGSLRGWLNYTPEERNRYSIFSVKQDVELLNENIIEYSVVRAIQSIGKKRNLDPSKIAYFLPHYSSNYFRQKVYDGMVKAGYEIPWEKWFTNLSERGNTGSASIYLILEELFHSGNLNQGDLLLCYVPESGRFSTAFMLLEVV